ncbi:MAG: ABC transporter substrate-binding protein [Acidobacteriota bacterium]
MSKRQSMTRRAALKALAGASAIALAPSFARTARAQAKPIRIGVIQPMSGPLAAYAQEGQPAFEYIINKVNSEGGIKSMGGAKLEILLADDTSQPARTAAEARRLVTQENVSLLTGSMLSSQMMAISPVIDELKMPTLSIWAGASRSSQMYSLGFPYDRGYAESMASFVEWLVKQQGFKLNTVASCYSNYEAGQQVHNFLQERLKARGFKVVGDIPLDMKAQDQTAAMVRIRSFKPDLVMGLVTPRDGILLHQARYNLNYHDSLFVGGTGGYTDLTLWKDLGPQIGTAVLTRNLFGMTGFSPGARMESMQNILTELKQKANLKVQVGQAAIQAAQAARVIQQVFELAGSTNPTAVLQAMAKVEIPFGDPNLYIARPKGLKFGEDRMLTDGSAMMIQWNPDQTQSVVHPERFAQAKPRPKA